MILFLMLFMTIRPLSGNIFEYRRSRLVLWFVRNPCEVNVYNTSGNQLGSAVSQNGTATVHTFLQPGSVAIIKIGQKSLKVVIR